MLLHFYVLNTCKCVLLPEYLLSFFSSKVHLCYLDIFQRQDPEWARFEKCWEEDELRGSGQSLNPFTLTSKTFSHHMFSHDWITRIRWPDSGQFFQFNKQKLSASQVCTWLNCENQVNSLNLTSKNFPHNMLFPCHFVLEEILQCQKQKCDRKYEESLLSSETIWIVNIGFKSRNKSMIDD